MSEARTEDRLGRLETDVAEIKTTLARLEPMIVRIDATLPYLATKAELADKPSRGYLWGVMAAMVGAQAVALAAAALIFSVLQAAGRRRPQLCRAPMPRREYSPAKTVLTAAGSSTTSNANAPSAAATCERSSGCATNACATADGHKREFRRRILPNKAGRRGARTPPRP